MQGISIKGHKLHEIRMPMVPYSPGVLSFLQYPSTGDQIFDPRFSDGGRKTEDERAPSSVPRLPSNPERFCDSLY